MVYYPLNTGEQEPVPVLDLLLMRHAKSDWYTAARTDFDRPLNDRGIRDAGRMARWMRATLPRPDTVVCSPAERTRQTVSRACAEWEIDPDDIRWEQRIYEAPLGALLEVLRESTADNAVTLAVGHNPGMEMLISHLIGGRVPGHAGEKAMPTAALAHIRIAASGSGFDRGCGDLITLMRPRRLPDE
jgi:phosphohistidine phosphatase